MIKNISKIDLIRVEHQAILLKSDLNLRDFVWIKSSKF